MLDPTGLYRLETDSDIRELQADVLLMHLDGFADAGNAGSLLMEHLRLGSESRVVASFDVDQLFDYRARRPRMVFDHDHWESVTEPAMLLERLHDANGVPFLLLHGPEPDYQWERFAESLRELVRMLGVRLVTSVHGVPLAVPHTRPVALTRYAGRAGLLAGAESAFGKVEVPGSAQALVHLRLTEAGVDTIGFAVHVPDYLYATDFADASVAGARAWITATGLDVPTGALESDAAAHRIAIDARVAEQPQAVELVSGYEAAYDRMKAGRPELALAPVDPRSIPSMEEIGSEAEQFLRLATLESDAGNDGPGGAATGARWSMDPGSGPARPSAGSDPSPEPGPRSTEDGAAETEPPV